MSIYFSWKVQLAGTMLFCSLLLVFVFYILSHFSHHNAVQVENKFTAFHPQSKGVFYHLSLWMTWYCSRHNPAVVVEYISLVGNNKNNNCTSTIYYGVELRPFIILIFYNNLFFYVYFFSYKK